MATAVRAVTGNQTGPIGSGTGEKLRKKKKTGPPTLKKGGVVMMRHNHQRHEFSLLSPLALRLELIAAVAIVLIFGRSMPEFGSVLRRVSELFLP
ncbi:MAG TPA: hypothetical protein VGS07_27410 [Thermoanaerobaculia bacterium]|jgi:hypothetical protein|nr:hypothetical protein [Thermoanaerobaculia bacterium]